MHRVCVCMKSVGSKKLWQHSTELRYDFNWNYVFTFDWSNSEKCYGVTEIELFGMCVMCIQNTLNNKNQYLKAMVTWFEWKRWRQGKREREKCICTWKVCHPNATQSDCFIYYVLWHMWICTYMCVCMCWKLLFSYLNEFSWIWN